MEQIKIGPHTIDEHSPTFIIAELSANHNHDYQVAVDTVKAAKEAGADAIKLQTYTADTLTIDVNNKYFKIDQGTLWDGKTFYQLYQQAYTPWEWHAGLQKVAQECGLVFFSTPFDPSAADLLETLDVPVYKIASFELVDIPLIEYVAAKGKPILMSTGIANFEEIKDAVAACRRVGNDEIVLLKCTSAYPAPLEEVNLQTIPDLRRSFQTEVGLSDHTLGTAVPVGAVALGARVIEKHFIIDKKLGGPDASFSLEPHEFKQMVEAVRGVEKALGRVTYEINDKVKKNRVFARSLFVVKDIKKGECFNAENVRSIRPSFGMSPKHFREVIGKCATMDLERGTPLSWEMIAK